MYFPELRWKYKDFWWLSYQPLPFCLHFETLLFENLFLLLQRNFWRWSQLPFLWLRCEFDMRRLFNSLQQYRLHWEVSISVKSAGTLATVNISRIHLSSYLWLLQDCYSSCAIQVPWPICCFTLPGDFAGFVSEQIGLGYRILRGKLPANKCASRWSSSDTGVLHASLSQIAVLLFVKPCDYRCF